MTQIRPEHYDEDNIKKLNMEILSALGLGAAKGTVYGITSYYGIGFFYPRFRTVRVPFKVFWFVSWIGGYAALEADKRVVVYSKQYKRNKELQEIEMLNKAAEEGKYIDKF